MAERPLEPRRWHAHTLKDHGPEHWQPLSEHLRSVAELAAGFAAAFGSADWARLAGTLHDLGKYAKDFQEYLLSHRNDEEVLDASILDAEDARRKTRVRVDHSSAGAVLVHEASGGEPTSAMLALAMVVAGHHAGLPAKQKEDGSFVDLRLKKAEKRARLDAARRNGTPEIDGLLDPKRPDLPPMFKRQPIAYGAGPDAKKNAKDEMSLRYEFWTRMLFSCLIDADRLDTEAFESRERAEERARATAGDADLRKLRERVDRRLEDVSAKARADLAGTAPEAAAVLDMRADVLAHCREAAEGPPGRYSLTVPTGGGKTLAALAFALGHAIRNDLRRVIVVIPFTSIIDQTAGVYREAFGDKHKHALIEHHGNLDPKRETVHNRLASENWDAPVIVTTSVQFFESLHADRGTAARKLHNIARSVVVFDEVQSLPHGLREPIFDCLNRLVDDYGVSILCCTATQPALDMDKAHRQAFPHLAGVREVVPDPARLFNVVKPRVTADFTRATDPRSWEEIADELKTDPNRRALAIVERRDDARDLWRLLKETGAFHLSALMCAEHRREVLAEIAKTLRDRDRPCRVVSTTLIEAGVDLDFPVVYRVLGSVDALAQASGRCNRAGALTDAEGQPVPGRLVVFLPTTDAPPGLGLGRSVTAGMLNDPSIDGLDLFDPKTYRIYFKRYLMNRNPDERNVMRARKDRDFPEVAKRFQMIDDQGQTAVVVPYGDAAERVRRYRDHPCRDTLRNLQPYIVNVSQTQFRLLVKGGAVETVHDQVHWIAPGPRQYDKSIGLIVDAIAPYDPKDLSF